MVAVMAITTPAHTLRGAIRAARAATALPVAASATAAAVSEQTLVAALVGLAHDNEHQVRAAVAANSGCGADVSMTLAADPDPAVSAAAARMLAQRSKQHLPALHPER